MTGRWLVLEVARWEFRRYFKPRQQLVGMLITLVSGLGAYGVFHLASRDRPVELGVVGDALDVETHLPATFHVLRGSSPEAEALVTWLAEGELDGVLRLVDENDAELVTRRRGDWVGDVRTALAAARQAEMLRRAEISPALLQSIVLEPELRVVDQGSGRGGARGGRIALILTLAVMLLAVFLGVGYVFSSITGEKQIRVTEQVVSAIPAQTWIDGKILGLVGVSLFSVVSTVVAFAITAVALRGWGADLPLGDAPGDPAILAVVLVFGLLGLFFWFSFLAAIAAMIDDPNNSARGSLLFLPILATTIGFVALKDPESTLIRVAALLPPTAPAAMPARMMLAPVPALEVILSLVLLAAGVLVLRIAAGRVFRLAMLMYGKEPSWSEVRRWIFSP